LPRLIRPPGLSRELRDESPQSKIAIGVLGGLLIACSGLPFIPSIIGLVFKGIASGGFQAQRRGGK
jgi:hypothetical protein